MQRPIMVAHLQLGMVKVDRATKAMVHAKQTTESVK